MLRDGKQEMGVGPDALKLQALCREACWLLPFPFFPVIEEARSRSDEGEVRVLLLRVNVLESDLTQPALQNPNTAGRFTLSTCL